MSSLLARTHVAEYDDAVVVTITGEVDLSNVTAVRDHVLHAVPNSSRGVILDLAETSYLDSQGIKMLLDLAYRLGVRRQKLHLVVSSGGIVESLLTIMAVPKAIPMATTVDEALRVLRGT